MKSLNQLEKEINDKLDVIRQLKETVAQLQKENAQLEEKLHVIYVHSPGKNYDVG